MKNRNPLYTPVLPAFGLPKSTSAMRCSDVPARPRTLHPMVSAFIGSTLLGSTLALAMLPQALAQGAAPATPGVSVEGADGDKNAPACVPESPVGKTTASTKAKPAKCAAPARGMAPAATQAASKAVPAAIPARPAASAESIRNYTYQTGKVYTVPTGLGIATQIVLDPAEKIRDYGTGFSTGWDIVRRDHVIYLKPKDPDAETNMYIRTDQRSYLLDLKIVSKDWIKIDEARAQGVAYVVQFNYPDVAARNRQLVPGAADGAPDPAAPPRSPYLSYHTDYEAASEAGAKWLTPQRVYDDGMVTYVQMPPMAQVPAFFGRLTDRGEEFLLNRSMDQGRHVLHGVYPFIIIRHGSDVVAVRRR